MNAITRDLYRQEKRQKRISKALRSAKRIQDQIRLSHLWIRNAREIAALKAEMA